MSTADTALSISAKMAPGPDHRQEPVAPDKAEDNLDISDETGNSSAVIANDTSSTQNTSADSGVGNTDTSCELASQSVPVNNVSDNKQEEPATLSTLNEGELRALLDEAITYKCPKDREGKSSLFKELLQEAEADETQEGRRVVTTSRCCLPGTNRRRHKRDSVSERLTHGGSLQNLAQPLASEFDSSFAYLTSGSAHTYGGNKRKNKKYTGPSVSARQREGGSLPSNVNASHSIASLANLDLIFDKKKGFCEERSIYDWTNKEKSKSLDKTSYSNSKKEEKEKDKKEAKKDSTCGSAEVDSEVREKRNSKGKHGTNEMLESDNPPLEYKSDYVVDDIGDVEVGALSERNVGSAISGVQRPHSLDAEDDEGTEMKVIDTRRSIHTPRTTFDRTQSPVDATVEFPLRDHSGKQEKSKISINGAEVTGALPFQTHTMKSVTSGTTNNSNATQGKVIPNFPAMTWQPISMEGSRYMTQHITMKDSASSGEKKSLDENGNAVQSYNGEQQKKLRRKHTREQRNVDVYNAESVEGHRNETNVDNLVSFIENKESKGKKGKANNNPVRVKSNSGTKPRARDKESKREQLPSKLQKSNSLEEISKTKLEDLTTEKSVSSSGASSVSSQQGTINIALRRAKQRSTGDATVDSRGDRRSWGTEEGQSIYCNDTGDDYTNRRNVNKKVNPEPEPEPDFLVVTKKKKNKKPRRSSSGSRAQNLSNSGSYLQNSRGFSNEYRNPLSPELRRKSASSMPPSDKSDSSDLDSVHSLPVTSNTSKHNLSKIANSSGGTPQASYADIARMATINMSPSAVLNMSVMVPTMLSTSSWPSVPPKTSSEPDKIPQDYYPSLDELQHSDRKIRQHAFAHSNHANSFEKPSSPPLSKKNTADRKKAEAQEEAINKNIQVFKYVQDIEKMQQSLTQQEQKNANTINHNTNSNETTQVNQIQTKINSTLINCNANETDNNSNYNNSNNVNKDSSVNSRCNNPRSRRNYAQPNQNVQNVPQEEQHLKKTHNTSACHDEGTKKPHNTETVVSVCDNKSNSTSPLTSHEENDVQKSKAQQTNPKQTTQDSQSVDGDIKINKTEKLTKSPREQQQNSVKHDGGKVNTSVQVTKQDSTEDVDNKKTKQQNAVPLEKDQKSTELQTANKKNNTARPAVILLDETATDVNKSNECPTTELTFGFEVNELLLSEDSEKTPTASPVFSPVIPPLLDKPPSNFDRPPPMLDKHIRYDKFPQNFHVQPPNTPHVTQHVHPVVMQSLPYISYPSRFPPPPYMAAPPPPPPGIIEKYHHRPKEDFSTLYVPPEEDVNVQNYNHDKIVSFVGSAWDAITANGHIEYYNGQ